MVTPPHGMRLQSVAEIKRQVCERYQLTMEQISGGKRNAYGTNIIAICELVYRLRTERGMTTKQIGEVIGREHSTVSSCLAMHMGRDRKYKSAPDAGFVFVVDAYPPPAPMPCTISGDKITVDYEPNDRPKPAAYARAKHSTGKHRRIMAVGDVVFNDKTVEFNHAVYKTPLPPTPKIKPGDGQRRREEWLARVNRVESPTSQETSQ